MIKIFIPILLATSANLARAQASMDPLPNRITALCGYGPDGLAVQYPPKGGVDVTAHFAPLAGLQYERVVSGPWSASALLMGGVSPQSRTVVGALGVGYGW